MQSVDRDEAKRLINDGRHIFWRHPWDSSMHEMKDAEHCDEHSDQGFS